MVIASAQDAFSVLRNCMAVDVEEFWVLALSPSMRLLQSKMLFRGTVDFCPTHPRDLVRFASLANASSLIIAHNHPSGELWPSDEDIKITQQLIAVGKLVEIPVLDHLLISGHAYVSFAERGWCAFR